jgi:hypothetical protein
MYREDRIAVARSELTNRLRSLAKQTLLGEDSKGRVLSCWSDLAFLDLTCSVQKRGRGIGVL